METIAEALEKKLAGKNSLPSDKDLMSGFFSRLFEQFCEYTESSSVSNTIKNIFKLSLSFPFKGNCNYQIFSIVIYRLILKAVEEDSDGKDKFLDNFISEMVSLIGSSKAKQQNRE